MMQASSVALESLDRKDSDSKTQPLLQNVKVVDEPGPPMGDSRSGDCGTADPGGVDGRPPPVSLGKHKSRPSLRNVGVVLRVSQTVGTFESNGLVPPDGYTWDNLPDSARCQIATALVKDAAEGRNLKHKFDEKPLQIYMLIRSKWWTYSLTFCAAVQIFLSMFESPCLDNLCAPTALIITFECLILTFFLVDMFLEMYAYGFAAYRRSGWNVMRIPLLFLSWVWLFTTSRYRIHRMVRPFFCVQYCRPLRKVTNSLFEGIKAIGYVGILLVCHLVIFSIIGHKFLGDDSPDEFGTFYRSIVSLFICLTTANFPDVMVPSFQRSGAAAIFFVVFLVLGIFVFLNLILAMVFNSYKERAERDLRVYNHRSRVALQLAFKLLSTGKTGDLSVDRWRDLMLNLRPDLTEDQMRALFALADADGDGSIQYEEFGLVVVAMNAYYVPKEEEYLVSLPTENNGESWLVQKWRQIRAYIVIALEYEIPKVGVRLVETFIDATVIINLILLIAVDSIPVERQKGVFDFLNTTLCLHFAVMIFEIIAANPPFSFFKDNFNKLDATVVGLAMVDLFVSGNGSDLGALRATRLLRLLRHHEGFVLLGSALSRSASVLVALFGILILIMYFFAVVGMDVFQGKWIESNLSETKYNTLDFYGMNYDQIFSGIEVQFNLLVVNNWHIFMDAGVEVTNEWARLFFMLFYVLGVLVCLNVITAFVLDTVMFIRNNPQRSAKADAFLNHIKQICNDVAAVEGFELQLRMHQGMDFILWEMMSSGDTDFDVDFASDDEDDDEDQDGLEGKGGIEAKELREDAKGGPNTSALEGVQTPGASPSRRSHSATLSGGTRSARMTKRRRRTITALKRFAAMHHGEMAKSPRQAVTRPVPETKE